jgi:hypothetical protein
MYLDETVAFYRQTAQALSVDHNDELGSAARVLRFDPQPMWGASWGHG